MNYFRNLRDVNNQKKNNNKLRKKKQVAKEIFRI